MRQICFAILLVPALAWAAPKSASDWYNEGSTQFTLGNFDKAVDSFKHAFELETDENKRSVYVYNIAQSYRQAGDCSKAYFFYKRFLSLKASPTVKPLTAQERTTVEGFIRDLEPCAQQAAAIGRKPPESLQSNGETGDRAKSEPEAGRKEPSKSKEVATTSNDAGDSEADTGVPKLTSTGAPHLLTAWVTGGGTKINTGDLIKVQVQPTFALVAGYPIAVAPQLTIHVGGAFTFTPVPFEVAAKNGEPAKNKTGSLISAMANAGVSYDVMPKLDLRGDLGVGALFFSASESSFTMSNATTGALPMLHVRAALSVDYAVTPNFLVTATPIAFSYSPPKDGLDDSIKSIISIDFMIGLGYRM